MMEPTSQSISPSSTVSVAFRSSERGSLLRLIAHKSQSLSQLQTTLLAPLQQLSSQLQQQKTIIHEAMQHNVEENKQVLLEQNELKQKYFFEIKKTKEQVQTLSQHKKVLVKEVRSIRSTVQEKKGGMDLYRFALQGVQTELHNETSSDRLSRTQSQSVERAKQLVLMRLSRKRDELNRLQIEINQAYQQGTAIHMLVEQLQDRVAVKEIALNAGGEEDSEKTPPERTRANSAAESWARRRISRVAKRFSPEKQRPPKNSNNPMEQKPIFTNQELTKKICECLSELMIVDEKLNQLVAVASYSDDVLAPMEDLKGFTSPSHELNVVKGMCLECCTLLQMNATQRKSLMHSLCQNLSPFDYAKAMAVKTVKAFSTLEPHVSVPGGLSIFLSTQKDGRIIGRRHHNAGGGTINYH